ncbi:MAG: protein-L-isoaspartate(D-aspartate) O-methyltransferase [Planctomycetes bacterium]|nr:protein-L-isoaspartate(D-aspartate) O-methyltransferase [Planctomycetota bacterium]
MTAETELVRARLRMVETPIMSRGVRDERVLDAMRSVRRHEFVPAEQIAHAYEDRPLPIGHGQTISQPYIVAWMTELLQLRPADTLLEIGAGCGYQTAVAARLCARVIALERVPELARQARLNLQRAGVDNAEVIEADGALGHAAGAPYRRILVAAAAPAVPRALLEQLAPQGRLVIPVGSREGQEMTVVTRDAAGNLEREYLGSVSFVPLVS